MKKNNSWKECAIEEWRQLQSIVVHLEKQEYAIRRWLITLIVGLTAVVFAKTQILNLTATEYGITTTVTVALFLLAELAQRVPKRKAIRRIRKIEECLREHDGYDGPKIAYSLSDDSTFMSIMLNEVTNPHVIMFYVPLGSVIALIAYVAGT